LAVICDAVEEGWPSMDYAAEMLTKHLCDEHSQRFETITVRPRFFRGFEALSHRREAFNADRLTTRFVTYPVSVLMRRSGFDLFHLVDHSYSQLLHVLPASRTGVFCHDLDTFAPVLTTNSERFSAWRRGLAAIQLRGLRKAAVHFHTTASIGTQLSELSIAKRDALVCAPYGIAQEFWKPMEGKLPEPLRTPFLLHVGGNYPRKRLDILFRVFSKVREVFPEYSLVQVGAALTDKDMLLVNELGMASALRSFPYLQRSQVARLYAEASLVLMPSEREGFGLPLVEALAAGSPVVASNIPPFREIGGAAVTLCPVGETDRWTEAVVGLLRKPSAGPDLASRHRQASRFSWGNHASVIAAAYDQLAQRL
jgi:glycosyltransferase involved in cell wall biosynthesis